MKPKHYFWIEFLSRIIVAVLVGAIAFGSMYSVPDGIKVIFRIAFYIDCAMLAFQIFLLAAGKAWTDETSKQSD